MVYLSIEKKLLIVSDDSDAISLPSCDKRTVNLSHLSYLTYQNSGIC